ncbi:MAG: 16S rRNA (cytidine(1402)-2'-O)-methyltransferase [Candidatus Aminicenantaceae bacterium]
MPIQESSASSRGRLYIVATPIGNLDDLTFRALQTLQDVDAIACEDTRQTRKLLHRYNLRKRLLSYFQPREKPQAEVILELLKQGRDVALVSDAGTPGISDPGFPLIQRALEEGIEIVPIPGASALTAALCAAGLPTHRVLFLGFPPPKQQATRTLLLSLQEEAATLVFYLPARRLSRFLEAIQEQLGCRRVVVARELTKLHEEFLRGTPEELLEQLQGRTVKGEVTLLIEGLSRKNKSKKNQEALSSEAKPHLD